MTLESTCVIRLVDHNKGEGKAVSETTKWYSPSKENGTTVKKLLDVDLDLSVGGTVPDPDSLGDGRERRTAMESSANPPKVSTTNRTNSNPTDLHGRPASIGHQPVCVLGDWRRW